MPEYTELEKEIARKYERITGVVPPGFVDQLRILVGGDMRPLLKQYIMENTEWDFNEYAISPDVDRGPENFGPGCGACDSDTRGKYCPCPQIPWPTFGFTPDE